MADRNAPGVSSPHQSSSSAAPLAGTAGATSVRSRNRRNPDHGNYGSGHSSDENLTRSYGNVSQRGGNTKGRDETLGLGQFLGDSWTQSWSSVQGFASSLLSVAENPGDVSRSRADAQSGNAFSTSLWNRIPSNLGSIASKSFKGGSSPASQGPKAANRVAAGSSDQRESALKTAQRASVLENNRALDYSRYHKRRNSDEIPSENSQPEEYLVYIHKIQPSDTYAGIILRYKCQEDAFRKANGLWSRDSIQVRKWVVIPVDACEVRGRPCDPPSSSQNHAATNSHKTPSQATPDTLFNLPGERPAPEDESAEKDAMPWSHVRWVRIDSLPEPVEIGRMARQKLGYFPPRRKKTGRTVSFSSTPRQSLDASTTSDQIDQPMSRRQSAADDRPTLLGRRDSLRSHGSSEAPDMRPAWMRRAGGVGPLSRNIRAPGPDKDYLNSWAKKHFPGLDMDKLPSMSVMGSEMARFGFDREPAEIVEGTYQEGGDTESPSNQNNGLDKAAAAVETWLRTAWSKRNMGPLIGGLPRQRNTNGQDFGDLIELTPTPGAEGTPRLDMFDSQASSQFLGGISSDDSSIKR
ncbi:carbohydrate-binding module family 50 protein [Trichoderma citrinoviride]|uniref:Carbohydrate-binding module family 50 protein n=1 Tax=Trichoderma citrinoviride TaxID=58853 RepID=A0A2T4B461_9HYPO|nr:carbohydrate-binding module family 50 protein [Trichoderma citrinoviride]PTB64038.1 carbohydrate-binding module family 50 protein [Trichoderma citrinoviride]